MFVSLFICLFLGCGDTELEINLNRAYTRLND